MGGNYKQIPIAFDDDELPTGTHICLIYSEEEERRSIISRFIANGIRSGEKVLYMADMTTENDIWNWLSETEVDIVREDIADQLEVVEAEKIYCPDGKFRPSIMLETLRNCYDLAIDSGFSGVRATGEMTWALKGIPGSDRLIEYEALVNNLRQTHPITPLCQYDATRFDGATILNVLKVHPLMIVHGQIVKNPYYLKPGEFFKAFIRPRDALRDSKNLHEVGRDTANDNE